MNKVIKDSLEKITDANCEVIRAAVILQLMVNGNDGSAYVLDRDGSWEADKLDSFRLIAHTLMRIHEIIDEAQDTIEDELKTGSTEA